MGQEPQAYEAPKSKFQAPNKSQDPNPNPIQNYVATANISCLSANYLPASSSLIKLHRCARSFKESRTPKSPSVERSEERLKKACWYWWQWRKQITSTMWNG